MSDWTHQVDTIVRPALEKAGSIDEILVAPGALDQIDALFERQFDSRPALIIADDNTWAAAGERARSLLREAGRRCFTFVLPGAPRLKPSVTLGETLRGVIEAVDAVPVVVGSGVLNDIVKYAAFTLYRPYLCVATAASMDGYASAGAPLTDKGFKKTIPCRPARAILADLDIIAAAPEEMAGWGYGDLAGKMPAGGDWIIADFLGIEPIDDVAWPLVQDNLRGWLADPTALAAGDRRAMAGLFTGLTISGLAMELHGTSRPASGADHQIAHIWEMEKLTHQGEFVSHGACVAIGCQTALALFDWLLAQDLTTLDLDALVAGAPTLEDKNAEIDQSFADPAIAERAKMETAAKFPDANTLRTRLMRLRDGWPALKQRLESHLLRYGEMRTLLAEAGAPVAASAIGVLSDRHAATTRAARFIRSRYTILDLLEDCGLLETALDEVFATTLIEEV